MTICVALVEILSGGAGRSRRNSGPGLLRGRTKRVLGPKEPVSNACRMRSPTTAKDGERTQRLDRTEICSAPRHAVRSERAALRKQTSIKRTLVGRVQPAGASPVDPVAAAITPITQPDTPT